MLGSARLVERRTSRWHLRVRWTLCHDDLNESTGACPIDVPAVKTLRISQSSREMTMSPVVATLAVCGIVLIALPVVVPDAINAAAEEAEPQDAPMSREQRIQVQQGLAALGFDPGPADGLFGPRTRAAVWDWQNAKGLEATGFLTREEAEALGARGQAAGAYNEESDPEVAGPGDPASEESAPEPSDSRNRVLYFPQCGGLDELPPNEAGCWQAISNHQECDFFLARTSFQVRKERFTWSGLCRHNAAHGSGTLKLYFEIGERTGYVVSMSGTLVEGRMQGDWVLRRRNSDGTVEVTGEGSYVDGVQHGRHILWYHGSSGIEETVYFECHHGECVKQ